MNEPYAILDAVGGQLVNFVMWDGNLETWQPPEETIAKKASEVDFNNLPTNPNDPTI